MMRRMRRRGDAYQVRLSVVAYSADVAGIFPEENQI
jgi:hypothetical protein